MVVFSDAPSPLHAFLGLVVATLLASLLLYSFISCSKLNGFLGWSALMSKNGGSGHVENLDQEADGKKKKNHHRLPPGSFGLPWIGETLQFALFNNCPIGTPSPFLCSRLHRYGPVLKTHLMGRRTVVSMDPSLNKFLLSNEEKLVHVYFPRFITKIVGPVVTVHGARHKRIREIAVPKLGPAAIQQQHLLPIQELALSILGSWAPHGKPHSDIDVQHQAKKFVFQHMVMQLISLEDTHPMMKELMEDYSFLMTGYSAVPLDFPGTTYHNVLKARARIIHIFWEILQERRSRIGSSTPDFLGTLIEAVDEYGKSLNDEDIVELLFFFVLGSFETTTVFLTNVLKFLSESPHVVDELRKEHLQIREGKKEGEHLTWDDYKEMHFTDLVMKETLRMASIVHYVTRETLQDIPFGDMVIPKGWMVLLNFSMVHLNPKYYPDPLKFNPWRWKDADNNNTQFLMPFGGGIRSCLGSVLAKFVASTFLHYFVTLYEWERIGNKSKHADVVSGLSFPTIKNGLRIRVEPRP